MPGFSETTDLLLIDAAIVHGYVCLYTTETTETITAGEALEVLKGWDCEGVCGRVAFGVEAGGTAAGTEKGELTVDFKLEGKGCVGLC